MMGILEGGELINVREYDGVVGAGEQDGTLKDVLFSASLSSFILDLAHGLNVLTEIISASRSNITHKIGYGI